jgi:hypothetical protein
MMTSAPKPPFQKILYSDIDGTLAHYLKDLTFDGDTYDGPAVLLEHDLAQDLYKCTDKTVRRLSSIQKIYSVPFR